MNRTWEGLSLAVIRGYAFMKARGRYIIASIVEAQMIGGPVMATPFGVIDLIQDGTDAF